MCLTSHIKTENLPEYIVGYKVFDFHKGKLKNRWRTSRPVPKPYVFKECHNPHEKIYNNTGYIANAKEGNPRVTQYRAGFHVYATLEAAQANSNDGGVIKRVLLTNIVAKGRESLYVFSGRQSVVYVGQRMMILDTIIDDM